MEWSFQKVFPCAMAPGNSVDSFPRQDDYDAFQRKVRWVSGRRVGVVVQDGDKNWHVAWFGQSKSSRHGYVPLLVGGSWDCDLDASDAIRAPFRWTAGAIRIE